MIIGDNKIATRVADLSYKHEGTWLPLPSWCKSYIELGIQVARFACGSTRYKIALALPTLAFAPTFVALGVVLESANQPTNSAEYSAYIQSQPIGTPVVVYRSATRKIRGTINGFGEHGGKPYIVIDSGSHENRRYPLPDYASKIKVVDREPKLRKYQQGGKVPSISDLLHEIICDPAQFVIQTQLYCLIVGQKSEFYSEVENIVLGIEGPRGIIEGTAQDILRIEQFLGDSHAYHCQIIASSEDVEKSLPAELERPPITIFAGASGYLKHHAKWPKCHQIILLDRTENAFQDAVDNLNENYGRRYETSAQVSLFNPPIGVDVMVFEEPI